MVDFKKLKANSGKKSLLDLEEQISKLNGPKKGDERFWSCKTDKAGNGFAIIRFLPAVEEDSPPFIKYFDHGFQGPGGWYIEKSRKTLGWDEDDPVAELNSRLYNSSEDENSPERKQAKAQKRRMHYVSNVYVIQDASNKDNEGKVFLFRYGAKIMAKIENAMKKDDLDPTKIVFNPFDLWEGKAFKIKVKKVGGFPNLDDSTFVDGNPGPLADDDKMKEIWEQGYKLQELIAPDQFKSYDELKARLDRVLGNTPSIKPRRRSDEYSEEPKNTMPSDEEYLEAMKTDDIEDAIEAFKRMAQR